MVTIKIYKGLFYMRNLLQKSKTSTFQHVISAHLEYMISYCKSSYVYYYFHYISGKYSLKYHFWMLKG